MPRRIVLVRHGRSEHVHTGLLNAAEFRKWRESYEAAGIVRTETPPPSLCAMAAGATLVASDTPRAIASAQSIAPGQAVVTSPLLRELELTPPDLGALRLPLFAWALLIGIRGAAATPVEIERARAAAEWLARQDGENVVAVTHAWIRRVIADALRQRGWRSEGPRRLHHWSAWLLDRE